jgi:ATPase subunit of ABC transporter with duplicated ATPase domains
MNYSDETADEMTKLQDEIEAKACGISTARSIRRWTRCAARPTTPMSTKLSGGERRRVALCKLLLDAARPAAARRADQPSRRRDR